MWDTWGPLIVAVGFIAFMLGLLVWSSRRRRRALACWQAVAASIPGMQMRGPKLCAMDGTIDGMSVSVGVKKKGTSESPSSFTHIVCRIPTPLPQGFALASENLASKLFSALGGQDHQIGDPDFDRRVRVRALSADDACRVLANRDIRLALADLLGTTAGLQLLPGGKVNFEERGFIQDPSKLSLAIRNTVRMASLLDQAARC